MFHYENKLKDLKVELGTGVRSNVYTIKYKKEVAEITLELTMEYPVKFVLSYADKQEINLCENAYKIMIGEGNLKREVYHFSTPDSILPTLRCGYTVHNGPNTWSSTPHPFEKKPEEDFEEVFLYLLNGKDMFSSSIEAIQVGDGMWEDGSLVNDCWFVHNIDISAIPMGYHPVVGEPGVHVSYIWAYLAKKKEWEKLP